MIRVEYIGTEYLASLVNGRIYDVEEVADIFSGSEVPFYKIHDDMGDDAYYPWSDFRVVDGMDEARMYGIPY